jgi:benzoyl-CoA 2,3-epoxidase subunit B
MIPNNVALDEDRRSLRAMNDWSDHFRKWWNEYGPNVSANEKFRLRYPVSAERRDWAHFEECTKESYPFGIWLAKTDYQPFSNVTQSFDTLETNLQNTVARILEVQGDTEPASIEQQHTLFANAPTPEFRNMLMQVQVEEARHLHACAYLLCKYFRDGRERAELLLQRHAGDEDKPRILKGFNEPILSWVELALYLSFQDRDGKWQLTAMSWSAWKPLRETCSFMLLEEANHMATGDKIIKHFLTIYPKEVITRLANSAFARGLTLFGNDHSSNAQILYDSSIKWSPNAQDPNYGLRECYKEDCLKMAKRWEIELGDELATPQDYALVRS